MKKPRFRVSSTRRVRYPVHGSAPTTNSKQSSGNVKPLVNRDRVTKKSKEKK